MDAARRRRESLHAYLMDVVRDLIARGMIRSQRGQKIEDLLVAEAKIVYAAVLSDLKEVGLGVIGNVVGGALEGLFRAMSPRR